MIKINPSSDRLFDFTIAIVLYRVAAECSSVKLPAGKNTPTWFDNKLVKNNWLKFKEFIVHQLKK